MFSMFGKKDDKPAGDPPAAPDQAPAATPEPFVPSFDFGAFEAPPAYAQVEVGPTDPLKTLELKPKIVEAISTVYDPEIPVNIYELGLVYDIAADAQGRVRVEMTLTSPACPSAQSLPGEVQWKVKLVDGVADARVDVVWEPPWSKDLMSEAARLQLGLF
jgi:FeS assembly SUF system protein